MWKDGRDAVRSFVAHCPECSISCPLVRGSLRAGAASPTATEEGGTRHNIAGVDSWHVPTHETGRPASDIATAATVDICRLYHYGRRRQQRRGPTSTAAVR